ncbi:MAG: hypothetical protein ACLRMZ_01220 [Blautia marasmi]
MQGRLCCYKKGSGTYVDTSRRAELDDKVCGIMEEVIDKLASMGKGRREIERMFVESAWQHIPDRERLKLAWIDCSEEFLQDTAEEIARFCNVRADAYLIDEIRENPGILNRERYDLFATTINHHDEVWATVKHVVEGGDEIPVEKVVLSVSNETISNIAKLQGKTDCSDLRQRMVPLQCGMFFEGVRSGQPLRIYSR